MSFAMYGVTHCAKCGAPLGMNEMALCAKCEREEKERKKELEEENKEKELEEKIEKRIEKKLKKEREHSKCDGKNCKNCKSCEHKSITPQNVSQDLSYLQREIQKVVNKYNSKIYLYYSKGDKKVHISMNIEK